MFGVFYFFLLIRGVISPKHPHQHLLTSLLDGEASWDDAVESIPAIRSSNRNIRKAFRAVSRSSSSSSRPETASTVSPERAASDLDEEASSQQFYEIVEPDLENDLDPVVAEPPSTPQLTQCSAEIQQFFFEVLQSSEYRLSGVHGSLEALARPLISFVVSEGIDAVVDLPLSLPSSIPSGAPSGELKKQSLIHISEPTRPY